MKRQLRRGDEGSATVAKNSLRRAQHNSKGFRSRWPTCGISLESSLASDPWRQSRIDFASRCQCSPMLSTRPYCETKLRRSTYECVGYKQTAFVLFPICWMRSCVTVGPFRQHLGSFLVMQVTPSCSLLFSISVDTVMRKKSIVLWKGW